MSSSFDIPHISREYQTHVINAAADITEKLQVDKIMYLLKTWDKLTGQTHYIILKQFLKMIDLNFDDNFSLTLHFNRYEIELICVFVMILDMMILLLYLNTGNSFNV